MCSSTNHQLVTQLKLEHSYPGGRTRHASLQMLVGQHTCGTLQKATFPVQALLGFQNRQVDHANT